MLRRFEDWDWDLMIPGHGRVRKGPEARAHLATVRSMFELMVSAAGEAIASETEFEDAKTAFLASEAVAILRAELAGDDPVAGKNFDYFVPPGFERAYLEAKSELSD